MRLKQYINEARHVNGELEKVLKQPMRPIPQKRAQYLDIEFNTKAFVFENQDGWLITIADTRKGKWAVVASHPNGPNHVKEFKDFSTAQKYFFYESGTKINPAFEWTKLSESSLDPSSVEDDVYNETLWDLFNITFNKYYKFKSKEEAALFIRTNAITLVKQYSRKYRLKNASKVLKLVLNECLSVWYEYDTPQARKMISYLENDLGMNQTDI